MPNRCRLYYITDRTQFRGSELERRVHLLQKIKEAAIAGVDYIQLREKDLSARDLEILAREAITTVTATSPVSRGRSATRILINSRADVALASGADGMHLRADDISPLEVRRIWTAARLLSGEKAAAPVIAVSCHTLADVQAAEQNAADFAVFGPVFEKKGSPAMPPAGLEELRRVCQYHIPVFALGGVTLDNASACLQAGAAGIAAIRLFQEFDINNVAEHLRGSGAD
jgi:thiamine-phosphate pyrophosphorylase